MGTFQECMICRREDGKCFQGYSWVGPGGVFDAKWVESGKTKWASFQANGQPVGFWNAYRMQLPRG